MSNKSDNPDYIVLWHVKFSDTHQPVGKAVRYLGNEKLAAPASLQIAQYAGDDGFYFFYLDQDGQEDDRYLP